MEFDSLNTLLSYLQCQIDDIMIDKVSDKVKSNMSESVNEVVYEGYTPQYYDRRGDNLGLSDERNMTTIKIENGIEVINDTPLDNGRTDYRLDDIIVNGKGYQPFPRDFYSDTVSRLEKNKDHIKSLKSGLEDKGIDVE